MTMRHKFNTDGTSALQAEGTELDNLLPLLHESERHKTAIVREFEECRKELVDLRNQVDELDDENARLRTELEERA